MFSYSALQVIILVISSLANFFSSHRPTPQFYFVLVRAAQNGPISYLWLITYDSLSYCLLKNMTYDLWPSHNKIFKSANMTYELYMT